VTIIDGFKVANSPWFIFFELMLNLLIAADFGCRLKLVGFSRYFKNPSTGHLRWWHIFDAVVVVLCNLLFSIVLFSKVESTSEELE
jgi:hypothetical protein